MPPEPSSASTHQASGRPLLSHPHPHLLRPARSALSVQAVRAPFRGGNDGLQLPVAQPTSPARRVRRRYLLRGARPPRSRSYAHPRAEGAERVQPTSTGCLPQVASPTTREHPVVRLTVDLEAGTVRVGH